jgi:hypothetical protein
VNSINSIATIIFRKRFRGIVDGYSFSIVAAVFETTASLLPST